MIFKEPRTTSAVAKEKRSLTQQVAEDSSQADDNPTLLQAKGHYVQFSDPNGKDKVEESDCNLSLTRNSLFVDSKTGPQHYEFAYRDFSEVLGEDYVIRFVVGGEISFVLQALGNEYDSFIQTLYTARNDQAAQDLLIAEGQPSFLAKGRIEISGPDDEGQLRELDSNGEIRVYKTLLGVFPTDSDPLCIRFADVKSSKFEDYKALFEVAVAIWSEDGSRKGYSKKIVLSQLGQNFDPFQRYFASSSSQVLQDTSAMIRETYAGISSINLMKLSKMLLDGIPTRAANLNSIDANFLKAMEYQISENKEDLIKCLEFLYSIGQRSEACLGAKKLVTNYLYILIPVNHGEVIALETNEEGHATYYFKKPIGGGNGEQLSSSEIFALALREVNYRREPIYLADEDMLKPQYGKYRFSVERIPALRFLRKHFIGRAIHSDFDAWKSQTTGLLSGAPQETKQSEAEPSSSSTPVTTASAETRTISPAVATIDGTTTEPQNKTLNLVKAPEQFMVERVLLVRNMEGVEEGRIKMWLRDDELDHDIYVKLSGSDIAQLGAFPGSKVKLSLQKA